MKNCAQKQFATLMPDASIDDVSCDICHLIPDVLIEDVSIDIYLRDASPDIKAIVVWDQSGRPVFGLKEREGLLVRFSPLESGDIPRYDRRESLLNMRAEWWNGDVSPLKFRCSAIVDGDKQIVIERRPKNSEAPFMVRGKPHHPETGEVLPDNWCGWRAISRNQFLDSYILGKKTMASALTMG